MRANDYVRADNSFSNKYDFVLAYKISIEYQFGEFRYFQCFSFLLGFILHNLKLFIIHEQRILTRCKFEYLENDIFHLKGLAMFSMTQQIQRFFINSFFTNNYTTCNFITTLFFTNLHAWFIFIDRATKSFVGFMTKKRYNTSLFI